MKPKIVVLGSLNLDLVVQVAEFPRPGQTVLGSNLAYTPGGKGANQAVAAARLGGEVAMIGKVGGDSFGKLLVENLKGNGVNTAAIETADVSTGVALISVSAEGENQIVVSPGANGLMGEGEVAKYKEIIKTCKVLLMQLEIPLAAVAKALELAGGKGPLVILNPAPAQFLPESLLKQIDILTPNETELAILSGRPVNDLEEAKSASQVLLKKGINCVVTTLGSKGALLFNREAELYIPGYSVKAVDTTAAGDAFSGALAVALGKGEKLETAIRFANKAGALTVTKNGAQTSLPYLKELGELSV